MADTLVEKKKPSPWASVIAGSVGGAAQVLVGQPLDTVKVRTQIAPPGQFKGPLDVAVQTIRKEGVLALYKGTVSPLIGISGVNSLLFFSYNLSRRVVSPYPDPSIPLIAVAGGMAGAANTILASPVELFKIRMQAQYGRSGEVRKLGDVAAEMWTKYGFRKGVMRGFWVTMFREIPAYAGFYAGYEYTKRNLVGRYHKSTSSPPVWILLSSGAIGGISYWTACYPLDVLKSRVQMAELPPKGWNYISHEFRSILQREGWRAFTRGLSATYLRSIPAAGSTFLAYELTMEFLQKNTNL
ncbi:mitochondrial carrier [Atractiella rhizophila]|nr:mitochondrial carrier [Atractiella rhizophila]